MTPSVSQTGLIEAGRFLSLALHDIKNLMMAPGMAADLVQSRLRARPELITDPMILNLLTTIRADLVRLRDFVAELEQLPGKDSESDADVQLSELVDSLQTLLASRLRQTRLVRENDATLRARKGLLLRAARNAVMNSLDTFQERKTQEPRVRVRAEGTSVIIEDNGGGFTSEVLEAIRTNTAVPRSAGRAGLGLLIIRDSMELQGGHARFENGPAGAVVTLELAADAAQKV